MIKYEKCPKCGYIMTNNFNRYFCLNCERLKKEKEFKTFWGRKQLNLNKHNGKMAENREESLATAWRGNIYKRKYIARDGEETKYSSVFSSKGIGNVEDNWDTEVKNGDKPKLSERQQQRQQKLGPKKYKVKRH